MVICLELCADLHMSQLMPLPLTVSCFSKIQIGFTFLVPAHPGSLGKRAVKRVRVCVCQYCDRISLTYLLGDEKLTAAAAAAGCAGPATGYPDTTHPYHQLQIHTNC